jgi:hypothetical protein
MEEKRLFKISIEVERLYKTALYGKFLSDAKL